VTILFVFFVFFAQLARNLRSGGHPAPADGRCLEWRGGSWRDYMGNVVCAAGPPYIDGYRYKQIYIRVPLLRPPPTGINGGLEWRGGSWRDYMGNVVCAAGPPHTPSVLFRWI